MGAGERPGAVFTSHRSERCRIAADVFRAAAEVRDVLANAPGQPERRGPVRYFGLRAGHPRPQLQHDGPTENNRAHAAEEHFEYRIARYGEEEIDELGEDRKPGDVGQRRGVLHRRNPATARSEVAVERSADRSGVLRGLFGFSPGRVVGEGAGQGGEDRRFRGDIEEPTRGLPVAVPVTAAFAEKEQLDDVG